MKDDLLRDYDRGMLRSAIASALACATMNDPGKRDVLDLIRKLGEERGLSVDDVADLAAALDLEPIITFRDRSTGKIYTPSGPLEDTHAPT